MLEISGQVPGIFSNLEHMTESSGGEGEEVLFVRKYLGL